MSESAPAQLPANDSLLLRLLQDGQPLDLEHRDLRSFAGVSPSRYRHAADQSSLTALQQSGGFEDLARLFNEHLSERRDRVENLASHLRVTSRQLPGLHRVFVDCCERLGAPHDCELYIGHVNNAWTSGSERPYVLLGLPLLAQLTRVEEVEFVIGHELGHVLSEHVLYHRVAQWAFMAAGQIPVVGALLQRGFGPKLSAWLQVAEFTADRAGLLACGNVEVAARFLMTLAGFPPIVTQHLDVAACAEQAQDLETESNRFASLLCRSQLERGASHPWPVVRAGELFLWRQSASYRQLHAEGLAAPVATRTAGDVLTPASQHVTCAVCNATIAANERYCTGCGAPAGGKLQLGGARP